MLVEKEVFQRLSRILLSLDRVLFCTWKDYHGIWSSWLIWKYIIGFIKIVDAIEI